MNLLERIAHSNGDPLRTIEALRLINEGLERELSQRQPRLDATGLAPESTDLVYGGPQPSQNTADVSGEGPSWGPRMGLGGI